MNDSTKYTIDEYYESPYSTHYFRYLGSDREDGFNFIATHKKVKFGEIIELGNSSYLSKITHTNMFTNSDSKYLTDLYITRIKRENAIDSLLGD